MRAAGLLVFPSLCKRCDRLLVRPREKVVCVDCLASLRSWEGPLCGRCGRFLDSGEKRFLCPACLADPPPYRIHRSGGVYNGALKDLILLMKYRQYAVLAGFLTDFLYNSLRDDTDLWDNANILVPIPLHPKRERRRGFNQSRLIAQRLSNKTGIPLDGRLLVKTRNAPPQTSLEAAKREENVRGAYRVRKAGAVEEKTMILVDDVCTTGSTLRACGEALFEAGAGEVRAITLARA